MSARWARVVAAFGAAVLLLAACTNGDGPGPRSTADTPTPPSSPRTDAWVRIGDAPEPARQEIAAAVVGGKIYVVGGLLADGATDLVDFLDPTHGIWQRAPELPVEIHHAMAAELNGKLVVMGGFASELGGAASARVFILDGGRWKEGPSLRRPRAAAAAVTITEGPDRIVVVGGVAGEAHVGPVEIFDGSTWRDGAPIPSLRDHLAAATDGQFVYVAGGRRAGGHFDTFEGYDLERDVWEGLAPMPTARSGLGAAVVGRTFIVAGGEGPRMFPEVEAYDVDTGRWRQLPDLAVPVHGVGLAAVGSNIYALVGGVRVGGAPSRVVQVLALG